MYKKMKILALIPARAGSKGLPHKNIRPLNGKPLIAWSIEHAKRCRYVDRIVVSTDGDKIARIARRYGADTPFLRPKYLARDGSPTIDMVEHAIKWLEENGDRFDIVALLEPTSPLRDAKDIEKAIEILVNTPGAESIVGVSEAIAAHPAFLVKMKGGFIRPFMNKKFKVYRRQDITKLYFFEGSLYISFTGALKRRKSFYHNKTLGYMMPKWKSYEVDDISDFIIIESLMKAKLGGLIG